jgi:hypothetical protein
MTPAKKSAKKPTKKSSKAFVKDLKEVLNKHNWAGGSIKIGASLAAADGDCPPGKTREKHEFTDAQGFTHTIIICK